MKKKIISIILAILLAAAPAAVPAGAAAFTPVTGQEMMERLELGINYWGVLSWEGITWVPDIQTLDYEFGGMADKATPELFEAIALKGFSFIRFQTNWMPHLDENFQIDTEWLDRVERVVGWAIDAGLYVIINAIAGPDETEEGPISYDEVCPYLTAVWRQTAERFMYYPERLIFDVMNEPHGKGWDVGAHTSDVVNRLNAEALAVIRKSGGYNDKRVVLLPTAGASTDRSALDLYVFPDDEYCMASIHPYVPWWFCLGQEAGSYDQRDEKHDIFPSDAERDIMEMFSLVKEKLADKNIPFLIGETGAVKKGNTDERVKWAKAYFSEAKKAGIPTCLHSDVGDYKQIEHWSLEWIDAEFLHAVFDAYGKIPGPDMPPPLPAFPHVLEGPYKDADWTVWGRVPMMELTSAEKLVIEHDGVFDWGYSLLTILNWEWFPFDKGHPRVLEEPEKITFDIRGLDFQSLGFAVWKEGDAAKIRRVYIDTWKGTPSLGNFTKVQTYDNNFTDIEHWSGSWIIKAYDYGIIAGSGTTYGTLNNMTVQDALVIASKMHGIYNNGAYDYNNHGAYPDGYITYALDNGLTDSRFEGSYTRPATRGELAYIWGNILPKEELQKLNDYAPFSDVPEEHTYYEEIKLFYEAGIVTGSEGRFNPGSSVTRGECAIMFVRLVSPNDRSGA